MKTNVQRFQRFPNILIPTQTNHEAIGVSCSTPTQISHAGGGSCSTPTQAGHNLVGDMDEQASVAEVLRENVGLQAVLIPEEKKVLFENTSDNVGVHAFFERIFFSRYCSVS